MAQSSQDNLSEIINTINRVAISWDKRDFKAARQSFEDQVETDYTSLGAPQVTIDSIDQLESNWRAVLPGFDMTQHLIGSHLVQVEGDTAVCFSNVQALHFIKGVPEGESWTVYGSYEHHLLKKEQVWRINKMKLVAQHQTGNTGLLVAGAMRAAQKSQAV